MRANGFSNRKLSFLLEQKAACWSLACRGDVDVVRGVVPAPACTISGQQLLRTLQSLWRT